MIKKEPTIVFYTGPERLFITTLIGNLYELAKNYRIILLAEKLSENTLNLLNNKELFKNIEKIIYINQFSISNKKLFHKNFCLYKLAKEIVSEYKPDIVITENDIYPFELYLLRFAKRIGAINIAIQASLKMPAKETKYYYTLLYAYEKIPRYIPLPISKLIIKITRALGHILVYWILPICVGEIPFHGKTSYITWNYTTGKRDADFYFALTKKDLNLFENEGVPKDKLRVLAHPMTRETNKIFKKLYSEDAPEYPKDKKIFMLNWPPISKGFTEDMKIIPPDEFEKSRLRLLEKIAKNLTEWLIIIKPHILVNDFENTKEKMEKIAKNISVADPKATTNPFIDISDVVAGPPPVSTTLFMATLQNPNALVLSFNLGKEFRGDFYKDFPNIEYIDTEKKLDDILKELYNGTYKTRHKELYTQEEIETNTVDLIKQM